MGLSEGCQTNLVPEGCETMVLLHAFLSLLPLCIQMAVSPAFATEAETVVVTLDHPRASQDKAPMVLIPAGQFTMGQDNAGPDEQPTHRVSLDAFYLDRDEVTVADYAKFLKSEDTTPDSCGRRTRRGHDRGEAGSGSRLVSMRLPIVGGLANGYRQRPSGKRRRGAPTVGSIRGGTTPPNAGLCHLWTGDGARLCRACQGGQF